MARRRSRHRSRSQGERATAPSWPAVSWRISWWREPSHRWLGLNSTKEYENSRQCTTSARSDLPRVTGLRNESFTRSERFEQFTFHRGEPTSTQPTTAHRVDATLAPAWCIPLV